MFVDDMSSRPIPVKSEASQGSSVLGNLLLLSYIKEIPSLTLSSVGLFADDRVVYRRISCASDSETPQRDINIWADWCATLKLIVNIGKITLIALNHPKYDVRSYFINYFCIVLSLSVTSTWVSFLRVIRFLMVTLKP